MERISAAQSEEERMNKDFDEVYKMKIVRSGKERESKLHSYDLKVIRELIGRYETKEKVRTRGGRELEPHKIRKKQWMHNFLRYTRWKMLIVEKKENQKCTIKSKKLDTNWLRDMKVKRQCEEFFCYICLLWIYIGTKIWVTDI